jgi:putative transposase
MKHHNTVFHQLLKFLPRQRFQAMVDRHQGDRKTRTLTCWDQMLALLFCQLSGRQSLRDLVDGFNSKRAHHYHLGTGHPLFTTHKNIDAKRPAKTNCANRPH